MYCPECGAQLSNNPKFCSNCGHAINGNDKPAEQISMNPSPETSVRTNVTTYSHGTKWLKFWNYFSLPVGGILGLLISLGDPALWIILVPISILQFIVAYGLHYRRLWAWQWNWVLVVITYITMSIPRVYSNGGDFIIQFVIQAVIGGLIWMWPNYVYWKKRRDLFS